MSTSDAGLTTTRIRRLYVPEEFAAANSAAGRAWIAELPGLVRAICQRWGLEIDGGVVRHGYHAVVLPVQRDLVPYVLKLSWPAAGVDSEVVALTAWAGRGAVRLFESDCSLGALLLERLNAQRTLLDLRVADAAPIAAALLRELVVPAPSGLQPLTESVRGLPDSLDERQRRLGYPVPASWLDESRSLALQLVGISSNRFLLHADLHYGNVLAGEREPWLAIDPKPISGDPEYTVAELLWTRADEIGDAPGIRHLLDVIVEFGALDAETARKWTIVRCVDAWLWGLDHGITEDPKRCERVLGALL